MMISGIQSSTRAPTMAIGPQAASRVQPLALARAVGRSPCSLPQRRRPSSGAPLRAPPPPTAPPAAAARPRRPVLCSAQQRPGTVELLLDSVAGKDEVLSAKLEPDVRQRAERAIAARGGRVTIGDVASTSGLRLDQAEAAVRALAADSQATLAVTEQGDILYEFPPGFRDTIRNRSLWLRAEPVLKGAKAAVEYALRVAFGTALFVSVAAVFTAIAVVASSGQQSDRDRRRDGGGFGYYGGGPRFYFDLTDLLWYWDPFYYRNRQQRMQEQRERGGMNFLEAIFSWVFGDGDPNADYDRRRWQAVGRYIQSRGGTVVAEELAPFLDLKPGQLAADRSSRITVDEGYMLPVLARFNGSPEVDASGNIRYTFPDLQQTATAAQRRSPPATSAPEQRWQLTAASAGQKLGAVALGALNLVGVVALSLMLQDPMNKMALARNGLLWVAGAMPWLQAYAAAFFAIPLVRSLLNSGRNAAIDERNAARQEAARLLQRPDAALQAKLASAAQGARTKVVSDRDVVYRSDRPLEQQPVDLEGETFEQRLERRAREREQQERYARPQAQQQAQQPGDDGPLWWRQQQEQQRRRERS